MKKIIFTSIEFLFIFGFFIYEYVIRGYKILIKEEEIKIFPYSIGKYLRFLNPDRENYNIKTHQKMAFVGLFLSGMVLVLFSMYIYLLYSLL